MKKNELIKQLETAKALSSTVDIDKVIALIKQIETPTTISADLGNEMVTRINRALDYNNNSGRLVDLDSAEFELNYNNTIELVSVNIEIDSIMEHVTDIIDGYVELEDEDVEEDPTERTQFTIPAEE
jgi:uncharacterized protein YerC